GKGKAESALLVGGGWDAKSKGRARSGRESASGGQARYFPPHPRLAIPAGRIGRRDAMSDMRLIVAGAGGRMGRTLVHAIAATDGAILAGAVEAASSAVIGRDAGELAGLGRNGVAGTTGVEAVPAPAGGGLDLTR